jgi:hypothetical protein
MTITHLQEHKTTASTCFGGDYRPSSGAQNNCIYTFRGWLSPIFRSTKQQHLHVSGMTITHLQEHKTTASTCFGGNYHPSSGAQNNSIYMFREWLSPIFSSTKQQHLHVSGVTIAHLQEHKTTASTCFGNDYPPSSGAQNNSIYMFREWLSPIFRSTKQLHLHVLGVTIAHLQEHKTTASTASGNHYTVIDRVKFTDKQYRYTRSSLSSS